MAIEKGQSWGSARPLPQGSPTADTDAQVAAILDRAYRSGTNPPVIGVTGGDLCRTVGGRGDSARFSTDQAQTLPCDAIEVSFDGATHLAVAHCVLRRSWLIGDLTVVMNAAWIGEWNVAPRAHPGDGKLDSLTVTMSIGDRLKARSRLGHGGHVPHPDIHQGRVKAGVGQSLEMSAARPIGVYADGVRVGSSRSVKISVLPDFFSVVV